MDNIDCLVTMAPDKGWDMCIMLQVHADVSEAGKMCASARISATLTRAILWWHRWLGPSISQTAGLVGCSWNVVVGTYQKWSKEGQLVKSSTGSWAPKARWRACEGAKAGSFGPLPQESYCSTVRWNPSTIGSIKGVTTHSMGLHGHQLVRVPMLTPQTRDEKWPFLCPHEMQFTKCILYTWKAY